MTVSYDILYILFYTCLVACFVFLAVSIMLFFVFKIPDIVGFLSGSTAQKEIKRIEMENSSTDKSRYAKKILRHASNNFTDEMNKSPETVLLTDPVQTDELVDTRQYEQGTTSLLDDNLQTAVLVDEYNNGQTNDLNSLELKIDLSSSQQIKITEYICYSDSQEVIL